MPLARCVVFSRRRKCSWELGLPARSMFRTHSASRPLTSATRFFVSVFLFAPFAVMPAVVVRQRKAWRRKDGVFIYFEDNGGVIVNNKGEMKGELPSAFSSSCGVDCSAVLYDVSTLSFSSLSVTDLCCANMLVGARGGEFSTLLRQFQSRPISPPSSRLAWSSVQAHWQRYFFRRLHIFPVFDRRDVNLRSFFFPCQVPPSTAPSPRSALTCGPVSPATRAPSFKKKNLKNNRARDQKGGVFVPSKRTAHTTTSSPIFEN